MSGVTIRFYLLFSFAIQLSRFPMALRKYQSLCFKTSLYTFLNLPLRILGNHIQLTYDILTSTYKKIFHLELISERLQGKRLFFRGSWTKADWKQALQGERELFCPLQFPYKEYWLLTIYDLQEKLFIVLALSFLWEKNGNTHAHTHICTFWH